MIFILNTDKRVGSMFSMKKSKEQGILYPIRKYLFNQLLYFFRMMFNHACLRMEDDFFCNVGCQICNAL